MKLIRTSTIPLSLNVLLKGQLRFLSTYFEVIGISSSGPLLEEVAEREGVAVDVVEMERGISPFKDFISLVQLVSKFRKEKPLIVHSITPKAGLLTMLAGKLAGVPIRIHTFTGLIFPSKEGLTHQLLILMDKLLCWSATHIYPEGEGVKNDLLRYEITSKDLRVLASGNVNGIDTKSFSKGALTVLETNELKGSLGILETDFVFVFVGRLVGDKGINELIKAFQEIDKDNVKLILVGPLETELDPLETDTLHSLTTNKNIVSVGFQKDVRAYFAISDALVFPSYREGFPNVVMQAGAMELPSIVTNINGCNEIIVEGENGTIIPVKNSKAIREAMLRFVDDKVYYEKIKSKARSMICSRYEQAVVWEAIRGEYFRLLKEKGFKHV